MEYIKLVFNIMAALLTKDMDLCCRCLLDSNPADFNHKQSQLAHKIRAPLLPVSCHHLHNQPLSHRPTSDWPKASPLPLFHWLWVCWGKKLTFSPPGGMVRPLTNNTKPLRGRPLRSTGFNRYFCWVSSPPRGRAAHHNQTSEGLCTARLVGRHRGMLQQQTVAKPVGLGEKKKKKRESGSTKEKEREEVADGEDEIRLPLPSTACREAGRSHSALFGVSVAFCKTLKTAPTWNQKGGGGIDKEFDCLRQAPAHS